MEGAVPFCDTPGQSAVVGVAAGTVGGVLGIVFGIDLWGVVAVACLLAIAGDLGAHAVRGDDPFQAALRAVRGR